MEEVGNNTNSNEAKTAHQEAVDFFEKHRDFFEHYAGGRVKIEPAPAGLDTFAFDFGNNTIYINSKFYEKLGLSEEKTTFATLHEIEHFLEKISLLAESGGERIFEGYLAKIKSDRAFSLLDNCVADIRENRAVVFRTSQDFGTLEQKLYKEDLFADIDFTKEPRHIQFAQAILRENKVPDEKCVVAPEVREKLDELNGIVNKDGAKLIDIITDPSVPMSIRLKLQEKYIVPMMRELLEKDKEEEKEKRKGKGKGEGENREKEDDGEINPNEAFGDAYKEAEKKIPNAVSIEKIEEAFKKYKEAKGEDPADRADKEYAQNLGVKSEDLKRYRQIVAELEKAINQETGESVIEELRNLIRRIISQRLKPAISPKYPIEEGEDLVDPAQLVADVKGGNLEPKVWESIEIKEKKGQKFGEIEITLVCDRSRSMDGGKLVEQRKASVLFMEALKEFADICDEERINMAEPLEVRNEIYSFQSNNGDKIPLKKMSKELGEKERIEIASKLSSVSGSTTDFVVLEEIDSKLDTDILKKIKEGELKKIVIVFTDGESDNPGRVQNILKSLRDKGVIAIGVGITESGKAALETYAPDARLAEQAEKLVLVLGDLLKEYLADL